MQREDFEGKPLPKHPKYRYNECLAKIVMEEMFHTELLILDKPDLQSIVNDIGIEVTVARDEKQLECERLYSQISFKQVKDDMGAIEKIEKSGAQYGNVLIGIPGNDDFRIVEEAIDFKLVKLNGGGYRHFSNNCLFVFSDIYADEQMLSQAFEKFAEKQNTYEKKFEKIYLYIPGFLYLFDFVGNNTKGYEIGESQFQWANDARDLVIEKEIK